MKKLILLLIVILWMPNTANAQEEEGVVYALLFYSPTCSHCDTVIEEVIPPLVEQYGDQFQVVYVDVTETTGRALFFETCDVLSIPEDQCNSVPNMIIGDTVMIGSAEIPNRLPQLVADGIENGGIPIPQIPTLVEMMETSWQEQWVRDLTVHPSALLLIGGLATSPIMILLGLLRAIN